jgi:hypothetical protein
LLEIFQELFIRSIRASKCYLILRKYVLERIDAWVIHIQFN